MEEVGLKIRKDLQEYERGKNIDGKEGRLVIF